MTPHQATKIAEAGLEARAVSSEKTEDSEMSAATGIGDPELIRVINVCPRLSLSICSAVLAMIKTVDRGGPMSALHDERTNMTD